MDSRLPEKSEQRYQTCWLGGDEEEGTLGFAPALPQQTVTLDHPVSLSSVTRWTLCNWGGNRAHRG